jgi:beta-N-acetylhexosaminidase
MTKILRDELHYEGVVFTDSMTMRGVTSNFSASDATLRAVEAGSDIVLLPPDVPTSFNAIKDAVATGRIPVSRIDASVRRILIAKAKLNLQDARNRFVDVNRLMTSVGSQATRDFAQHVEDLAITLVRDARHSLPLRSSPDLRVVQVNIVDTRTGWREGPPGRVVAAELVKRFPRAVTVQVDDQSTASEIDLVRKLAQMADALVVNGFIRVAAYKGSIDLTAAETALLKDLEGMPKPFVFTVFGSPYVLTQMPELPSYIVTYDTSPLAESAAVRAITGEIEFKGKLPISLPGLYPIGHGLSAGQP